jgi:hypothetical protein
VEVPPRPAAERPALRERQAGRPRPEAGLKRGLAVPKPQQARQEETLPTRATIQGWAGPPIQLRQMETLPTRTVPMPRARPLVKPIPDLPTIAAGHNKNGCRARRMLQEARHPVPLMDYPARRTIPTRTLRLIAETRGAPMVWRIMVHRQELRRTDQSLTERSPIIRHRMGPFPIRLSQIPRAPITRERTALQPMAQQWAAPRAGVARPPR